MESENRFSGNNLSEGTVAMTQETLLIGSRTGIAFAAKADESG
jgi:hypothetical protein